jgi:hypothetical protein
MERTSCAQVACGFVGQQHRGRYRKCARNPDPLLFAARQLAGSVPSPFGEADLRERVEHPARSLAGSDPGVHQGQLNILEGARALQKVVGLEGHPDPTPARNRARVVSFSRETSCPCSR